MLSLGTETDLLSRQFLQKCVSALPFEALPTYRLCSKIFFLPTTKTTSLHYTCKQHPKKKNYDDFQHVCLFAYNYRRTTLDLNLNSELFYSETVKRENKKTWNCAILHAMLVRCMYLSDRRCAMPFPSCSVSVLWLRKT